MIYSPDHKFLLLKNHKVGGTSLEVPVSMVVPENAIVTPKTSDDPSWKLKDEKFYNGYNPRNYSGFYNHMTYSEISNKIDLTDVKSYVFIRNPFNIVLSNFFHRLYFIDMNLKWINLNNNEKSFLLEQYFNDKLGAEWKRSTKKIYLSDNNDIQVTKFLRYEYGIEEEINPVLIENGLSTIKLNVEEKRFRPETVKYYDVFSNKHLDIIHDEWKWEFNCFGYEGL
jgi:predicted nucleic-acid-binding protein